MPPATEGEQFGENSYVSGKCQFPVERTVILRIHTPYVVIFKSPATEGEQFGENTYVSGKCQNPVERTVILRIHKPVVVIFKSPATEGGNSAKIVSSL